MRTQIALRPEQHARVRQKAAELGISMAEYIRRLVDQDLTTAAPEADLGSITGLFGSGESDVSADRTKAIQKAVSDWAAKKSF